MGMVYLDTLIHDIIMYEFVLTALAWCYPVFLCLSSVAEKPTRDIIKVTDG